MVQDPGRGKAGAVEWLNEPPAWQTQGDALVATAGPKTDFWRTTHYGFVRDNGHAWLLRWEGDFVAEVTVTGGYRDQYDQAGLMVRLDETVWLKCGVEFVGGVQQASAVVTRDHSDWSVAPLPANPRSLRLRVARTGPDIDVRYAVDGARFELLRLARLTDAPTLLVGPMCAAPDGSGFETTFTGLTLRAPEPD